MRKLLIPALLIACTAIACKSKKVEAVADAQEQTAPQDGKKPRGEKPNPQEIMNKLDTNKDGKIAKDEAKGPMLDNFATVDANSDGYISLEELKNAPKPERPAGGNPPRR